MCISILMNKKCNYIPYVSNHWFLIIQLGSYRHGVPWFISEKEAVRHKYKKMRKSKACFLIHAFYLYVDSVWNHNLFQM